ncbi:MAG: ATP-binding protein [Nanoarchaeota archaeon]|nr:ATP-binding protein [Nanoarchaeota archaeon]MBU4493366.1 ATP-binding protein [Nanoarchaeota archaeon]
MQPLIEQNPWWEKKEAIEQNIKIQEYNNAKLRYKIRYFPLKRKQIYVLRGPRQIGKTTTVMLNIQRLIKDKINPKSIFYYSCDLIKSQEALLKLITDYLDFSASYDLDKKYIFLDEVTTVTDWADVVKHLKNIGKLEDCSIVITGSNSIDLKKGSDRLPGRGIEGNEHFIMPLLFSDYLTLFGLEKKSIDLKKFEKKQLTNLFLGFEEKQRLFRKYILSGGLLKIINRFEEIKGIDNLSYETYIRWIEGDIAKIKKNPATAKQICQGILLKMSSQLTLHSFAKEMEIPAHSTISDYLELLEELFLIKTLNFKDLNKGIYIYRKPRKVYFRDPFYVALVNYWIGKEIKINSPETESKIVEGIVFEHLCRSFKEVSYYSDKKGEIDFIVKIGNKNFPIEVKWKEKVSDSEIYKLNKFKRGLIISKKTFKVINNNYAIIPAALFCSWSLGK